MGVELKILVGTMTGTAEYVADAVKDALAARAAAVEVVMMDHCDASIFASGGAVLICTSTYGQGDVPDNARDLLAGLEAGKPDLSGIKYGVIALGDRTHAQTYCFGGIRFDTLLHSLGARRIGDILMLDASSGVAPEDAAAAWSGTWIEQLQQACRGKAA